MKLTLSGINFTDLLGFEDVLKQLSPQRQLDDLDSYLIYTGAELILVIREANSFAKIDIPVIDHNYSEKDDIGGVYGLIINNARLYHTLHSYSLKQLEEMVIEIEVGDTSAFRIIMPNDKLSLSHLTMTPEQIKETLDMISMPVPPSPIFDISLFNDGKEDFIHGLVEGMSLVEDSEKKNNAFALYNDRLIVNYNRHVFIYHYDNPVVFPTQELPVSLHKKIAKMFITLASKKRVFDAKMSPDGSRVIITSATFKAVMNNALSNINPPTQDSLDNFRSDNRIASARALDLRLTTQFIYGYYLPGKEYNAIIVSAEEDGIRFTLKDSGVTGFNTCQVDRLMKWEDSSIKKGNSEPVTSIVVVESLLAYLKQMKEDDIVEIFMDDKEEHIAVYLSNPKREIYLAKMSG